MAIDLSMKPIDPDDEQAVLANMQGNILKGHGRDFAAMIFVRLKPLTPASRARFSRLASAVATSALQQRRDQLRFKRYKLPGRMFGNVFLSASGYRALGFDEALLRPAFEEVPLPGPRVDSNFVEGMAAHGGELGDPPPSQWEEGFKDGRIDALFLLADDDEHFLVRQSQELFVRLESIADIVAVERGAVLRDQDGEGIEHFGYVDGRSQPLYFADDLEKDETTATWDPFEPLERVLVADPFGGVQDAFGSYFVFRKLEQQVKAFRQQEERLADELGFVGEDRQRAGAMAVGRFRNGSPLTLSACDDVRPRKENDFDYAKDKDGRRCPFHAHIRKVNPRGDIEREHKIPQDQAERARRITRRGIPFGKRVHVPTKNQPLDQLPEDGVGLLFMCFQRSIRNQFAFIQKEWAEAAGFVRPETGKDPLIGQQPDKGQQWRPAYDDPGSPVVQFDFGRFVHMKGGEFFFAPSIPFLKLLAPPR